MLLRTYYYDDCALARAIVSDPGSSRSIRDARIRSLGYPAGDLLLVGWLVILGEFWRRNGDGGDSERGIWGSGEADQEN